MLRKLPDQGKKDRNERNNRKPVESSTLLRRVLIVVFAFVLVLGVVKSCAPDIILKAGQMLDEYADDEGTEDDTALDDQDEESARRCRTRCCRDPSGY